jgi:hypothetical protein
MSRYTPGDVASVGVRFDDAPHHGANGHALA